LVCLAFSATAWLPSGDYQQAWETGGASTTELSSAVRPERRLKTACGRSVASAECLLELESVIGGVARE
jgi:hypothetical protein